MDTRDESWDRFINDPEWISVFEESRKNGPIVREIEQVFLSPTIFSNLISFMKILANDGISESGKNKLEEYGFEVDLTKVSQEQLVSYINENEISTILVRSATQVRADIIDNCPTIKIIGRGV